MEDSSVRLLQVFYDLSWLPQPNEIRVVQTAVVPPVDLITSVHVLAFAGDRLLMTHLKSRGWDIPGGHRHPEEDLINTVLRETYEETCVHLANLQVFAHSQVRISASPPDGYRYPCPDSYILIYTAQVDKLDPFVTTAEAVDRRLFSPMDARQQPWIQQNQALYEAALASLTGV